MELKPDDIATIKRLVAIARDVIERYNALGEQAAGVFREFLEFRDRAEESFKEIMRELDEIDERLTRIEQLAIYDRAGINPPITQRMRREIGEEVDTKHLRRMLASTTRKLQSLQEQAAQYTSMATPTHIILAIEETEDAIRRIREELKR